MDRSPLRLGKLPWAVWLFLASCAVLWVLVGPIIALVSASRANRRADDLQRRLFALEGAGRHCGRRRRDAAAVAARVPYAEAFGPKPAAPPAEPVPAAAEAAPAEAATPSSRAPPEPPSREPVEPEAFPRRAASGPAAPRRSDRANRWKSKIGARWTVLVGGLALALGAIFLVRYSIEQGLLGPDARIALGLPARRNPLRCAANGCAAATAR